MDAGLLDCLCVPGIHVTVLFSGAQRSNGTGS